MTASSLHQAVAQTKRTSMASASFPYGGPYFTNPAVGPNKPECPFGIDPSVTPEWLLRIHPGVP